MLSLTMMMTSMSELRRHFALFLSWLLLDRTGIPAEQIDQKFEAPSRGRNPFRTLANGILAMPGLIQGVLVAHLWSEMVMVYPDRSDKA